MEFLGVDQALTGIAPMIIAGIISALASAKAGEDSKVAAATQAAGAGAEGGGGFDMKPTDLLAQAAGPSPAQAEGSKINESLMKADGQTPPPAIAAPSVAPGTGPLPQGPPVNLTDQAPTSDLDVVQIPTDAPPSVTGEDPSKMSLEAKMAMAAQLGSLLRGPPAPRPPSVGAGPGINMQPVFLKDLQ